MNGNGAQRQIDALGQRLFRQQCDLGQALGQFRRQRALAFDRAMLTSSGPTIPPARKGSNWGA
ncbi:hypothetical protein LP420_16600 [Massilia sp. B-10]|nr:hypothetical protein LP420_16600 [Massilia sp. B-10]